MCRHNALKKVTSDCSPLHWQYGAIARLGKGESIEPLLYGGYSSISLGYIGLYETTKLMKGVSPVSYTHLDVYKRQVLNERTLAVIREFIA